jgi:hypothetical protein
MEADSTAVPVLRCATVQLLMQPWQHHAPWVWPCAAQDAHAGVHMCSSLRRLSLQICTDVSPPWSPCREWCHPPVGV